jgi:hypothetical protein
VTLAMIAVFGLLGLLYSVAGRAQRRIPRALSESRRIWSRKFRVSESSNKPVHLQVLRRVNLTATHQLHLISTTEDLFLVCTHPHGCTLLRGRHARAHAVEESAAPEEIERYAS